MALLKFLKGNYTSLSTKAISEGQILICGDTGEMFVDVAADKRVKIGDFSVVANIAALEALDASAVPTSRLYYVEDGNILARSNGTSWIQINKQKTLAELGGVSLDVYNTKMTALDKADTDNATAIAGVDTRLQAAEEKLKSVATTEGLGELTRAVEGNTAKIDTIMGDADTTGSMLQIAKAAADGKDAAIKEAKDAADAAQADVDELAQTHATDKKDLEDAIALKADADDVYTKGEIDSKVDAIDDAIADKANADDVYTQGEIDEMISALEGADEAIHELIGTVDGDKTIVEMIADAQRTATYDDAEVKGLIDTNKGAIEKEVSDRANAISGLKTELEGKINAKVEQSAYDQLRGDARDQWFVAASNNFTYTDYVMFTYEQQQAFQATFSVATDFDNLYNYWLENMTYEEFMALTMHQKLQYRKTYSSIANFLTWYNSVKPQ